MPKRIVIVESRQVGGPMGNILGRQTSDKPVYVARDEASAANWLDKKEAEAHQEFNNFVDKKREEAERRGQPPPDDDDFTNPIQRINSLSLGAVGATYLAIWTDSDI